MDKLKPEFIAAKQKMEEILDELDELEVDMEAALVDKVEAYDDLIAASQSDFPSPTPLPEKESFISFFKRQVKTGYKEWRGIFWRYSPYACVFVKSIPHTLNGRQKETRGMK